MKTEEIEVGDVIFYIRKSNGDVHHVAIVSEINADEVYVTHATPSHEEDAPCLRTTKLDLNKEDTVFSVYRYSDVQVRRQAAANAVIWQTAGYRYDHDKWINTIVDEGKEHKILNSDLPLSRDRYQHIFGKHSIGKVICSEYCNLSFSVCASENYR